MKKTTCFVLVAGIFLSLPMILTGGEKPAVQLAGLRVVGAGYGLNGSELRAFNQQSGTSLELIVQAPKNKKIVEVDKSKCSLLEFTDDRDQNLLDGISWGAFPEISKDGQLALIEVTSKNRPYQDATRLFARGTIHIRVAASEITEKIENIKLEVGAKANVQQEVIQVMKVQNKNEGLILGLQINRKFVDNMKDIRFFTKGGDPLEIWGRGSFTFGNVSQVEYNVDTKSTPETLKIEIDLWQELETLDIPFQIESGVGF